MVLFIVVIAKVNCLVAFLAFDDCIVSFGCNFVDGELVGICMSPFSSDMVCFLLRLRIEKGVVPCLTNISVMQELETVSDPDRKSTRLNSSHWE